MTQKTRRNAGRILLVVLVTISYVVNAQSSTVAIYDFHQLSFPTRNPGHLGNTYLPAWSKGDRYIGTTLHDPNVDRRYVMIYDLKTGIISKFNTAMTGGQGKEQSPFEKRRRPKDTHTILWSPIKETTFYTISRDRKIDQLFEVSFREERDNLKIINTQNISPTIPGLADNHILSYSLSNPYRKRFYILFSLGKEGNMDVYSYSVSKTGKSPQVRSVIRSQEIDEYDIQSHYTREIKHYVFQGKIGNQDDIFSMKEQDEIVNLTKTDDLGERNPIFNPSGSRIAFLRTDKLFISDVSEEAKKKIIYSIVVYDFETETEKEIYSNVYVIPDVFRQSTFIWLNDDLILFVDNNVDMKFPLKVYHLSTDTCEPLSSPYINHKDLALSHDGKHLAFIAKGTEDTKDLSYDKLFVCDIKIP